MIVAPPQLVSPYAWLVAGATLTGLGTGMSAPAANNASVELAPDDVGAITGLRGAARQGGAIVGITLATSLAAHSGHEAHTLAEAFVVLAALLACMVPLVWLVPDGKRTNGAHHQFASGEAGARAGFRNRPTVAMSSSATVLVAEAAR